MPSITLKYGSTSRTFSRAVSVKGFLPTDGQVAHPDLSVEMADGTLARRVAGFRRVFRIDLGNCTTADLSFLGLFLNSTAQYIGSFTYTGIGGTITETDVGVVDRHDTYESEWVDGVRDGNHIYIELEESAPRVDWPQATQGYGYQYGTSYGTGL